MNISPIGISMGGTAFGGFGSNGGKNSVQSKINSLEAQLEKYEQQKKLTADRSLDEKIGSLERRIENLKGRIEKKEQTDTGECETCENRQYQDGSDDPGVSFKSATKISPEAAAAAVRGHEMEHVYRNQAKAEREGREIVSQSVRIKTAICPECGKSYVSGGETRTATRAKQEDRYNVGKEDASAQKGMFLDSVA